MKNIALFVLLCITALATGCPKGTPARPGVVTRIASYEIARLDIDTEKYECAVNGETFIEKNLSYKTCGTNAQNRDKARQLRDEVAYRLIRITDYNYFQFENDLYIKRASGSVLADIIDTGANLAATITNGERAKTIINASIIAFRGGRKSASIHYFQEQTADVLITKMQTARNRVLAEMLIQMRDKDVDKYPLDAALGDVIKYFYAGTLPRALQELKQDASIAAKQAKDEIEVIKGIKASPVPTEVDVEIATKAQAFLKTLDANLKDPNKKDDSTNKLKSIAKKLEAESKINGYLIRENTSTASEGQKIADTLKKIRKDINFANDLPEKNDLLKVINTAIVSEDKENK